MFILFIVLTEVSEKTQLCWHDFVPLTAGSNVANVASAYDIFWHHSLVNVCNSSLRHLKLACCCLSGWWKHRNVSVCFKMRPRHIPCLIAWTDRHLRSMAYIFECGVLFRGADVMNMLSLCIQYNAQWPKVSVLADAPVFCSKGKRCVALQGVVFSQRSTSWLLVFLSNPPTALLVIHHCGCLLLLSFHAFSVPAYPSTSSTMPHKSHTPATEGHPGHRLTCDLNDVWKE